MMGYAKKQIIRWKKTYKKIDQTKQGGQDEFSKVNNFHINFLRELQSNQALCIDVTKIQDPVMGARSMAIKISEARSFLERYAAYIRSCENGNDIKKAVKEYAERNYAILQTILSDPEQNSALNIRIEYQEFSVPGSTTKYPKFCGFAIRE
jgi:hypothetical protein